MGVRAEFDSIHTRMLHTSSTLTMAHALSDLLAEETRLQFLSSFVSHCCPDIDQIRIKPRGQLGI